MTREERMRIGDKKRRREEGKGEDRYEPYEPYLSWDPSDMNLHVFRTYWALGVS